MYILTCMHAASNATPLYYIIHMYVQYNMHVYTPHPRQLIGRPPTTRIIPRDGGEADLGLDGMAISGVAAGGMSGIAGRVGMLQSLV